MSASTTTSTSVTNPTIHPFRFHGETGAFFQIWTVNMCLSVITLGIYTAWAKVRTTRYFYGNCELDGHRFDYHADPKRILKGRIIALAAFIAYQFSAEFDPRLGIAAFVLFLAVLPWLINASMRFHARMTSYRRIRFGFRGSYWGAFLNFVFMPILGYIVDFR